MFHLADFGWRSLSARPISQLLFMSAGFPENFPACAIFRKITMKEFNRRFCILKKQRRKLSAFAKQWQHSQSQISWGFYFCWSFFGAVATWSSNRTKNQNFPSTWFSAQKVYFALQSSKHRFFLLLLMWHIRKCAFCRLEPSRRSSEVGSMKDEFEG